MPRVIKYTYRNKLIDDYMGTVQVPVLDVSGGTDVVHGTRPYIPTNCVVEISGLTEMTGSKSGTGYYAEVGWNTYEQQWNFGWYGETQGVTSINGVYQADLKMKEEGKARSYYDQVLPNDTIENIVAQGMNAIDTRRAVRNMYWEMPKIPISYKEVGHLEYSFDVYNMHSDTPNNRCSGYGYVGDYEYPIEGFIDLRGGSLLQTGSYKFTDFIGGIGPRQPYEFGDGANSCHIYVYAAAYNAYVGIRDAFRGDGYFPPPDFGWREELISPYWTPMVPSEICTAPTNTIQRVTSIPIEDEPMVNLFSRSGYLINEEYVVSQSYGQYDLKQTFTLHEFNE